MKTLTKTRTVEEIYGYEAADGTFFLSEEECRAYESSAKCVSTIAVNKIRTLVGSTEYLYDVLCSGDCDTSVYVYHLRTEEDLRIANWHWATHHYCSSYSFDESMIGKDIAVQELSGDWATILGDRETLQRGFSNLLDKLFGKAAEA